MRLFNFYKRFKKRKIFTILFFSSLQFFLTSCDPLRVFEENREISDYLWDQNEKISFDVTITDTLSPYNFYVNVRNADGYPFSNLYVFINTYFPDGRSSRDTLECILADESGKWLGDGLGDIWDNQILFKRGVRFPKSGKYIFIYEQGMRMEQLPMIMDVGLRIEKQQ